MNTFRLFNKNKKFNKNKRFNSNFFRDSNGKIDKALVCVCIYGSGTALTTLVCGIMAPMLTKNKDMFDVIEHTIGGLIFGFWFGCIWPYTWAKMMYRNRNRN